MIDKFNNVPYKDGNFIHKFNIAPIKIECSGLTSATFCSPLVLLGRSSRVLFLVRHVPLLTSLASALSSSCPLFIGPSFDSETPSTPLSWVRYIAYFGLKLWIIMLLLLYIIYFHQHLESLCPLRHQWGGEKEEKRKQHPFHQNILLCMALRGVVWLVIRISSELRNIFQS